MVCLVPGRRGHESELSTQNSLVLGTPTLGIQMELGPEFSPGQARWAELCVTVWAGPCVNLYTAVPRLVASHSQHSEACCALLFWTWSPAARSRDDLDSQTWPRRKGPWVAGFPPKLRKNYGLTFLPE